MQGLCAHLNCVSLVQEARLWSMANQCSSKSCSAQKEVYYDPLQNIQNAKELFQSLIKTSFFFFSLKYLGYNSGEQEWVSCPRKQTNKISVWRINTFQRYFYLSI